MNHNIRYGEDYRTTLASHEDLIGRLIAEKGTFFEEWVLTPLKEKVTSFDCTIDIGANIGNHAKFFKEVCKARRIICFEPHPANIPLLKENCPSCELFTAGLSSQNTEGFLTELESINSNSGTGRLGTSGYPITIHTLDNYRFANVSFIKIDVEGLELEVLRGAKRTIERYHPDIMVEIHTGIAVSEVTDLLPGYTWEKISFESHYLFKYATT
jgi:protein O-GlcNAc transferase